MVVSSRFTMPQQHLDSTQIRAASSRCVAKQWRKVCGCTTVRKPAPRAALLQAW